ncbi:hypothetical protein CVT24_009636 [Panaeolus cyanescens]|uniref:F-box domain-containing protein n=1 Tax=Panaeolus cyanescens TaxID=181874 RepID=A0A409YA12_9AGAR|nr:hypothetical protein CVT24_009636 [Panaeolus cyanescens]
MDLPLEILLIIFKNYVDTNPFTSKRSTGSTKPHVFPVVFSPFQLMAVCRGWRSTVIALPELWTNITLINCNPRTESLLTMYLERSAERPLSIVMFLCYDNPDYCLQTMNLLRSHAPRWQEIDFRFMDSYSTQVQILHAADLHLPMLRKATLSFHPEIVQGAEVFLKHVLSAPALKSVTWIDGEDENGLTASNGGFFQDAISRQFPWAKLQELTLFSIVDMRALFNGLCAARNLAYLSLDWHRDQPNPTNIFSSSREVILPELVTLKIRSIPHPCVFNILRRFITPKLSDFELMGVSTPSNRLNGRWNTTDLLHFFGRSGCRLTKFSCRYTPTSDGQNDSLQLLQSVYLERLSHLTLVIPKVTQEMMDALTRSETSPKEGVLLPELAYVKLRANVPVGAALQFALSRRNGYKRLDVLDFTSNDNIEQGDREKINMLEEAGTVVKFTTSKLC